MRTCDVNSDIRWEMWILAFFVHSHLFLLSSSVLMYAHDKLDHI